MVLGGGAEWIWNYTLRFLAIGHAAIVEIVDLYLAWEHWRTAAHAVFGDGTRPAVA